MSWMWDSWKRGFDAWERVTADMLETGLRSSLLLQPSGALLAALTRSKRLGDRVTAAWVRTLGMATKGEQERTLHAINQVQSRLLDIEEQLAELRQRLGR